MSKDDAQELIDETEQIFNRFGMDGPVYPTDMAAAQTIRKIAKRQGIDLLIIKQKHLGSDRLPDYIADMAETIRSQGVVMHTSEDVRDITTANGRVTGVITNRNRRTGKTQSGGHRCFQQRDPALCAGKQVFRHPGANRLPSGDVDQRTVCRRRRSRNGRQHCIGQRDGPDTRQSHSGAPPRVCILSMRGPRPKYRFGEAKKHIIIPQKPDNHSPVHLRNKSRNESYIHLSHQWMTVSDLPGHESAIAVPPEP